MSDQAIEYFIAGALFYKANGNLTLYNSIKWDPTEVLADPSDATLCSLEKGKCQCPFGSIIFYGAKNSLEKLDTS